MSLWTADIPLTVRFVTTDNSPPRHAVTLVAQGGEFGADSLRASRMQPAAAAAARSIYADGGALSPDVIWECMLMLSQALPEPVAVQNGFVLFSNRAFKPLSAHNVTSTAANDGHSDHVACTSRIQQGRVDVVNGDTVISALQQTWALGRERSLTQAAVERLRT
eukprot:1694288-Amphidinium_carterae.2